MGASEEFRNGRCWGRAAWAVGALALGAALVAKQFIGEPSWIGGLAQSGILLIGIGVAIDIASRKTGRAAYRAALGLAIGSALLLGWVNGAVGIIGTEDNAANLMYAGVALVGVVGASVARLEPKGMARTLVTTAAAQTLVAVIALAGQMGSPYSGPLELVTINGFFVALFLGSAALFTKAEEGRLEAA